MTYAKQMQKIVYDYRLAGESWPAATKTIASWAIRTGRWELPASAAVNKCAEDLQSAMRDDYITDRKGRRVRRLHPAKIRKNGVQATLWDDIQTAPRQHMQISFQQRRKGVVGDCRQLKLDVDSYSDAHKDAPAIPMVFDFTMDLAEIEAAEGDKAA